MNIILSAYVNNYNIAAILVFFTALFYCLYRRLNKSSSSKTFIILISIEIILTVLDILITEALFDKVVVKILGTMYYLLYYQSAIIFIIYIIQLTKTERSFLATWRKLLFSFPFLIVFACLVENIFTNNILVVNSDLEVTITFVGSIIFNICLLTYYIIGIAWVAINMRFFSKAEKFVVLLKYILTAIMMVLSYLFNKYVHFEYLADSIVILIMCITTEKSRTIVDHTTELGTRISFERNINIKFKHNYNTGLLLISIRNYDILFEKFNYDNAIKRLKEFANQILTKYSNIHYRPYYINGGVIGIILRSYDDAKELANLINKDFNDIHNNELDFNFELSICVIDIPNDIHNSKELMNFLFNYEELIAGESQVLLFSDERVHQQYNVYTKLDEVIDEKIKNKDIIIDYLPALNLKKGKYLAAEALASLYIDGLGLIEAEVFIPYAEKKNIVFDIDMLVVEKVFSYYQQNKDVLNLDYLTINISSQTIINKSFKEQLLILKEKYQIEDKKIIIEINELNVESIDSSKSKHGYLSDKLMELIDNGFILSLDNYGIGNTPIDTLAKIPFWAIKLDKSFASGCEKKETNTVINHTIKLIGDLNKVSISTGIENAADAAIIEKLNPNYVQGYYYSKPLDGDELIEFLEENGK